MSAQQLFYSASSRFPPPSSNSNFPEVKKVVVPALYKCTSVFQTFTFFFFNICNGKSTRGNLLQLFLSCHQGDAVRRASVEPWGGGRQGEKGRGEEWVKGTQSPQTHVHMCIWGLSVHTHIHTCVVLYNKYQSATDHLSVVIITVIGKNFFFL